MTLMNIHPLIAARYVEKVGEWQIATNVSFQIPRFEEGQNVVEILQEMVMAKIPLGIFEIVPGETDQEDTVSQVDQDDHPTQRMDHGRHSPWAFSPLIVKMSETTQLRTGMTWRPWITVTAVPYSVLSGPTIPAKLAAVSVAHLISTGMLDGDEDLDARVYSIDWERFYKSDCSDCELKQENEDDEKEDVGLGLDLGKDNSDSDGPYKIDDPDVTSPLEKGQDTPRPTSGDEPVGMDTG
ncbi:hypothetical protein CBR_g49460 [Chara braunii]|uniref:Uncharacterized protein n=1 Tax=Chara braunii TaxID=69332 RepID=A0A388K507_CHABU|nr:hypothetical protein CBR_g49460 [Chara braunii]|eukprot:GBG65096.1 hypothetical protein CBR_g49460 [Chara braunii]